MGEDGATVMVIGWNEADQLQSHLQQLSRLKTPVNTELVAVIGGDDGTYSSYRSWAETQSAFDDVNIIEQQPTDGISGTIQRGFNVASGDFILYLEMDTEIEPTWLTEMVNEKQHTG